MGRFIEGADRGQLALIPTNLEQCIEESNPVRVVDAFIYELAVNSRDRNFTRDKRTRRLEQITESIGGYLEALDVADLQEGARADEKVAQLTEKVAAMRERLAELKAIEQQVYDAPDWVEWRRPQKAWSTWAILGLANPASISNTIRKRQ